MTNNQPLPQQHGIIDKAILKFNANKKPILAVSAAVLVIAASYAAYEYHTKQVNEELWKGLFKAELAFVSDKDQSLTPLENFAAANAGTDAAILVKNTLGNAYYQQQDYTKAAEYFKQVAASTNKNLAALAEVSLIATDVAQKDYASAITKADAFASKNPTHFALGQVLQYKALAQDLSGNSAAAKESYTKLSMQYPNTYYSSFADLRLKELK